MDERLLSHELRDIASNSPMSAMTRTKLRKLATRIEVKERDLEVITALARKMLKRGHTKPPGMRVYMADQADAEIERLRAALAKYGDHSAGCHITYRGAAYRPECTCGWEKDRPADSASSPSMKSDE